MKLFQCCYSPQFRIFCIFDPDLMNNISGHKTSTSNKSAAPYQFQRKSLPKQNKTTSGNLFPQLYLIAFMVHLDYFYTLINIPTLVNIARYVNIDQFTTQLWFWAPMYNQCLLRLSAISSVTRIQFNIRHWRWSVTAQLNTLAPTKLKTQLTKIGIYKSFIE